MWAKDVGREAGAGKPLLKTILQVNLKLFAKGAAAPASSRKRTALVFVFRDRTRTPVELLAAAWEADLASLWASLAKPPGLEAATVSDFFDVHHVALPNFEEKEGEFQADAAALAARFDGRSPDALVPRDATRLPGAAWALAAHTAWDTILASRDLDLPSHRVMVASIRCGELARAALDAALAAPEAVALASEAAERLLPDYGARAALVAARAAAAYDGEARYYEAGVVAARRADLTADAAAALKPGFDAQLVAAAAGALAGVREALAGDGMGAPFAERAAAAAKAARSRFAAAASSALMDGAPWTAGDAASALDADVAAFVGRLTADGVAAAEAVACGRLRDAVVGPATALLDACPPDVWPRLSSLLARASDGAVERAGRAVAGFGLPAADAAALADRVRGCGRSVLLARAREAAATALPRAKERFADAFSRDEAGLPRQWGADADVAGAAATARAAAARLLAALAADRLDGPAGPVGDDGRDLVEAAVGALAARGPPPADCDVAAATEWPASVPSPLIQPPALRAAWRTLSADSAVAVAQALSARDAHRAARRAGPPLWALAAIAVLGANEAVSLLKRPFLLLALAAAFLFCRSVYDALDVDAELSAGLLPGAIALSAKLGPTVRAVAGRTLDAALAALAGAASGGGERGERVAATSSVELADRAPRPGGGGALSGEGVRQRDRRLQGE
jgi:hypothetical protein